MPGERAYAPRDWGLQIVSGITLASVTLFLAGCFGTIPIETEPASNHFDAQCFDNRQTTTARDVVMKLGDPAVILRSETETYYVYEETDDARVITGLIIIAPPYFIPYAAPKAEDEVLYCIAFRFDEKGELQDYRAKTVAKPAIYGVIAGPRYWGKTGEKCLQVLWDEKELEQFDVLPKDDLPE